MLTDDLVTYDPCFAPDAMGMSWVAPIYGKSKVRKAGQRLVDAKLNLDEPDEAFEVLSNWRASHAYPMQSLLMLLRNTVARIDETGIVAQRLKRTPSILAKLAREEGTLDRMEDIAGCRAVLPNWSSAETTVQALQKSRTQHDLTRTRDYVKTPKSSGYRGIHLIFRYGGQKPEYAGLPVELQVRSSVQHSWATAVEVAGTFTKQALKASRGNREWLDYFKYASAELAQYERLPVEQSLEDRDTRTRLMKLNDKHEIEKRLSAFTVTTQHIGQQRIHKDDYFILRLDMTKGVVTVERYASRELERATKQYALFEREVQDTTKEDVVLVSAGSVDSLRKAYPNYFADTRLFLRYLRKATGSNGKER